MLRYGTGCHCREHVGQRSQPLVGDRELSSAEGHWKESFDDAGERRSPCRNK